MSLRRTLVPSHTELHQAEPTSEVAKENFQEAVSKKARISLGCNGANKRNSF